MGRGWGVRGREGEGGGAWSTGPGQGKCEEAEQPGTSNPQTTPEGQLVRIRFERYATVSTTLALVVHVDVL